MESSLRAEDELAYRSMQAPLTPERIKQLTFLVTHDKKQAEQAYVDALKAKVFSRKGVDPT